MSKIPDDLPSGAGDVARAYPAIWKAYSALGEACAQAGPIDRKAVRLVKLALAIGAPSEGWCPGTFQLRSSALLA
jgi:alkylhydroperoxidase/carboxymuconolactone decarboxylase family protein YurZ